MYVYLSVTHNKLQPSHRFDLNLYFTLMCIIPAGPERSISEQETEVPL